MARKTPRATRPAVVDDDEFEDGDEGEFAAEEAAEPVRRPALRSVSIDVQLGPKPAGIYVTRHIDAHLETHQAETLRKVFDGLAQQGARLDNGRYVASVQDAVRWLLEEIGRAG